MEQSSTYDDETELSNLSDDHSTRALKGDLEEACGPASSFQPNVDSSAPHVPSSLPPAFQHRAAVLTLAIKERDQQLVDEPPWVASTEDLKGIDKRNTLKKRMHKKTRLKNKKELTPEYRKAVMKDLEVTYHTQEAHDLAASLRTDLEKGLDDDTAQEILSRDGPNEIVVRDRLKWVKKFFRYFFSGFGIVLWPAAILSIIAYQPLGSIDGGTPDIGNIGLAVVLLLVALLNGLFNAWQDWKSSRVINALAKTLPRTAMVTREGTPHEIPLANVVAGDLVILSAGSRVPADCRLVSVAQLRIDNSMLTGESEPVMCTVDKTDDNFMESRNIAFMGTSVIEGSGIGIAVATGDRTIMGKISALTHRGSSASTPITKEINRFMMIIVILACTTAVIILLSWGLWLRESYPDFISPSQIVVTVIGTMIAFLPDGLPLCITLTLTMIARRMQRVNVMVKSLPTVETLGSVDVIASDKTGTITANRMSVMHYLLEGDKTYRFNNPEKVKALAQYDSNVALQMLVKISCLCNEAIFEDPNGFHAIGNASDVALLQFSDQIVSSAHLRGSFERVADIPFNSRNKWMLVACAPVSADRMKAKKRRMAHSGSINSSSSSSSDYLTDEDHEENLSSEERSEAARKKEEDYDDEADEDVRGEEGDGEEGPSNICVMLKGAPEYLLKHCTKVLMEDGTEAPLDDELVARIGEHQETFSSKGERVLGLCYKYVDKVALREAVEDNVRSDEGFPLEELCFVGLVTLIDPPKEDVAEAIAQCRTAGVSVLMVTGDHPSTALAIAKMVGLVKCEQVERITSDEDMDACVGGDGAAAATGKRNKRRIKQDAANRALVVCGADLASFSKTTWTLLTWHKEIVFARTTPEQKLLIVKEFQKRKHVVAVTGDGVNDSPALKQANVGVAMGSGSEVAKEAADIVLVDAKFSSIVRGIYYGRLVFENLRKVVLYLLPAGSFSELMPILTNIFLGLPLPLSSFLMIVICAGTDALPSLSMIYEAAESKLMEKKPRSLTKEKLVNIQLLLHAYFFIGMMESVTAFGMYFYYMSVYGHLNVGDLFLCFDCYDGLFPGDPDQQTSTANDTLYTAQTVFFVTLVVLQVCGNLLSTRTRRSSIFQQLPFRGKTKNNHLFVFGALSIALAVQIVYLPLFNDVFNTRPIPVQFWFIPIGVGLLILLADELRKVVARSLPLSVVRYICW